MTPAATAQALRAAEDELQHLRGLLAVAVAFIHDPAYDAYARRTLANRLGLPGPRTTLTVPTAPKEAARGH
jgi:hypothetical protein